MASTADIKNGLCIIHSNSIYQIVSFQHVKPGKGSAFVRTKLKNMTSGKVIDNTFSAGHKITTARIERRVHQFLYKDDIGFHFMDLSTYEQSTLPENLIDDRFLTDGLEVDVLFHAETDKPLVIELPQFIIVEVIYTEPGLKGDTATNATKSAKIDSGAEIQVPLFINQGEKIKIDTQLGNYVERIKE